MKFLNNNTRYFSLYKPESTADISELASFLKDLTVHTVDPVMAKELDAPLWLEEIMSTIKTIHNSKAPGPDGFSINF